MLKPLIAKEVANGLVRVLFKEFPLGMRETEVYLARVAFCAGEQGRYLEFLDKLYQHQKEISTGQIPQLLLGSGVDPKKHEVCMLQAEALESVQADVKTGNELGVRGTPTFFVNGREMAGFMPYQQFLEKSGISLITPKR